MQVPYRRKECLNTALTSLETFLEAANSALHTAESNGAGKKCCVQGPKE
jgi:hypothetical protein